jgi:hypothetical protein
MYSGKDSIKQLGILSGWNGNKTTKYNYGECSMVNGTTGELWPPLNGTDDIELFATDLCRYFSRLLNPFTFLLVAVHFLIL